MTTPPPRRAPVAPLLRLLCLAACVALAACVQPAHERVVVYLLDAARVPPLADGAPHRAGVRGEDAPLSWERDSTMTPVLRDSLFRTVVTYRTGALVTEMKFTLDGIVELEGRGNRRIRFAPLGDTTVVRAVFDAP